MTKVKDIFSKAGRNRCPARFSGSDKWNPNRPAQFTQEEFLEHLHEIEKGPFTPLDIANREFEEGKVKAQKKSGLDEALEDVKAGRIHKYENFEAFKQKMLEL